MASGVVTTDSNNAGAGAHWRRDRCGDTNIVIILAATVVGVGFPLYFDDGGDDTGNFSGLVDSGGGLEESEDDHEDERSNHDDEEGNLDTTVMFSNHIPLY